MRPGGLSQGRRACPCGLSWHTLAPAPYIPPAQALKNVAYVIEIGDCRGGAASKYLLPASPVHVLVLTAHTLPSPPSASAHHTIMAVSSRTREFREYVRQKEGQAPDHKRRKLSRPAKRSPESERQELLNKEYVKEAYNVVSGHAEPQFLLASSRHATDSSTT